MPISKTELKVEVRRGGFLESTHLVSAVQWRISEGMVASWGDLSSMVFPRSSIKMLQALLLAQLAKAQGVTLPSERMALATASHLGEAMHSELARAWLTELGYAEETLRCGAHRPFSDQAAQSLQRADRLPLRFHNNCSGKHVGMIHACLLLGLDPRDYYRADHPVQLQIARILEQFGGMNEPLTDWAIDGCGIPAWRMPLSSVAQAMARFGRPDESVSEWTLACQDVFSAMSRHPLLIGGTEDYSSAMTAASEGRFIVKIGAEGFMTAAVPSTGDGFALKVHDGAERAAEAAMSFLLRKTGHLAEEKDPSRVSRVLHNWAGEEVGEIRVVVDEI